MKEYMDYQVSLLDGSVKKFSLEGKFNEISARIEEINIEYSGKIAFTEEFWQHDEDLND